MITDIQNKNEKMQAKIDSIRGVLVTAKEQASDAKSTWEKLRKERDYHKQQQVRVNDEKIQINTNIKKIKVMHDEFQDKIDELNKKLNLTTKEKAMLKLEKDKLQKRAHLLSDQIKTEETKVQRQIEAAHNRQKQASSPSNGRVGAESPFGNSTFGQGGIKQTPYPEDARPNPYLAKEFEPLPARPTAGKRIDAHNKGIGGMALHARK